MEKIGMEVVNNLQLLVQSKNGMAESAKKRGLEIVGGLKEFPSKLRKWRDDTLKPYFKIQDGWKLGYTFIMQDYEIDLQYVTDGSNMFREGTFQSNEETLRYQLDVSMLENCSHMMYGVSTQGNQIILYMNGGEHITNMDYAFSNMSNVNLWMDYRLIRPTSMIGTFEGCEIIGYGDNELWYTVNTENVEDFTGLYKDSKCWGDVYVNISNAKYIDEMFNGCKKEQDIYFFGDPSKLESMTNAFNISRIEEDQLPRPIFKYDYRYDYSHVLEEVRKIDALDIQPMTEGELNRFLQVFPSWVKQN